MDRYPHVTFQNVAEHAKVGRATLYRRWPTPAHLVADAIRSSAAEAIVFPDTGNLIEDLRFVLTEIAAFISNPLGRASLIAGLQGVGSLPQSEAEGGYWPERWNAVAPMFERAKSRGELRPETNAEVAFSKLAGALYFRLLVMGAPLTDDWIELILDDLHDNADRI